MPCPATILRVPLFLAAFAPISAGQCADPVKLVPGDAVNNTQFGSSISAEATTAVIGAWSDSSAAPHSGSVYVLQLGPTGWGVQQKLFASDGTFAANFGLAAALSGDTILVGAANAEGTAPRTGAVYVYELGPSGWLETDKLLSSDGSFTGSFGRGVALQGDVAVLGANYQHTSAGQWTGAAYVFERIGGTWTEVQKLVASDAQGNDGFGGDVELDGDLICVGAQGADDYAGAAYIFERSSSGWSEVQKLAPAELDSDDYFGWRVALDGNCVVVGARGDDDRGADAGAAYVYDRQGSGWSVTQKLFANDGGTTGLDEWFGIDAALRGDQLLVGASRFGHGAGYLFRRTPVGWVEERKVQDAAGALDDNFGFSVALAPGWAFAGALRDDAPGLTASGALHVFGSGDLASTYCHCVAAGACGNHDGSAGCANSTGAGVALRACGSASVGSDDLILWADDLPANRVALLAMGDTATSLPFGSGELCVAALGGGFYRFPVQVSSATGRSTSGPGLVASSANLSAAGSILAGQTRTFQLLYRDPGNACAEFGASSALSATFVP